MENSNETLVMRVGYTYVPVQSFDEIFPPEEALEHGSLFKSLYLPMEVYGPKGY